jgi:hypothetical protein
MSTTHKEFIGVYIPEAVNDCLRLQSIIESKGKSEILREILETYMKDNSWTVEKLAENLSIHYYSRWYLKHRKNKTFAAYLKDVKIILNTNYKLPDRLIKLILEQCKEQQKKNPFQDKSNPE